VRATLINPDNPADWVDFHIGNHVQEKHKALAEVAGVPAMVFVTSPAADTYQIQYAYGTGPEPNDSSEFTMTDATEASAAGDFTLPSCAVGQEGLPSFVYWSSLNEQLVMAWTASGSPASPADWTATPLCSPGTSGSRAALIDWQGQPLAAYAGIGQDHLRCSLGASWQPPTIGDWERYVVDNETLAVDHVSICELPNGIAVAYRQTAVPCTLMCAWFTGNTPQGPGDWCVMPVISDLDDYGTQAVAALANGQPAIAYVNTDTNELWLATMDPL